jgi:hypothetical protein
MSEHDGLSCSTYPCVDPDERARQRFGQEFLLNLYSFHDDLAHLGFWTLMAEMSIQLGVSADQRSRMSISPNMQSPVVS